MNTCILRRLFLMLLFCSIISDNYAAAIPPVPTKATIATDLIGRKLSEGTDNGYFSPDWRWTIEPGEISGMKIQSQSISDDYCSFVVSMYLQSQASLTKYYATVQVDYSLKKNKWTLILVKSKGVNVVKSGKYLDCISTNIVGNERYMYLRIKNNVDSSILVGGIIRIKGTSEWQKFSLTIEGLEEVKVDSSISPYYGPVVDYQIHFVELL